MPKLAASWCQERRTRLPALVVETATATSKLHSTQLNGHFRGSQQTVQGINQGRGQGSRLVEHNLNDLLSLRIHDQKTTDMKRIANHAQRAIVPQWRRRGCQPG